VVDLPGTLGPTPLVGIDYLAIIAAAVVTGGVMITWSHWLAWAAADGVAAAAMGGYVLTRAVPGGFLGDHTDVGNWRCSLGIAALSVEAILLLFAGLAAWQSRRGPRTWRHCPGLSRPGRGHPNSASGTPADQPVRAASADSGRRAPPGPSLPQSPWRPWALRRLSSDRCPR
jgi:hypothetical protein